MNYRDFFNKKGAVNKDIKTLIPEGVSLKEFYKGVAIEKESVGDEFTAAKLASNNLEKDADYYTKLHGNEDAECNGVDASGDEYDENGGLPLIGGALAVPHVGQPIRLGKIVQIGAEFGKGSATGELSGMTAMGGVKNAGGLPVSQDGDKETITAGGKGVDSSIASKTVGGNVVPGEGQKQGGPNSKGKIAGTSKLAESHKVRKIVEVLKEITFNEKSGKWVKINETKLDAMVDCSSCGKKHPPFSDCPKNEAVEEPECEVCGLPESECECMPESINMKMGASHKIVQPRQYKVSDDDFARTNQYEPEITEMYDEEEESIMNERYLSLVNAFRNLSESELSEMKSLRGKLENIGENNDNWIQNAVNPAHKGDCTPMSKPSCTPHKKALARRFKKGLEEQNEVTCSVCGRKFEPSYGEHSRCDDCLSNQHSNAEKNVTLNGGDVEENYGNPDNNPKCNSCGDELKKDEQSNGICFTCKELENNRRYRLHNKKGEYDDNVQENSVNMKMGTSYKVVAPRQFRVQSDDQARNIQFDPELTETEQSNQPQGQWRQNGGNGFSFIVSGKEIARIAKAIGNKFIVSIGGKNVGTVSDVNEGKEYIEGVYYGQGKQQPSQPALEENEENNVDCPECGNTEGNNQLNHNENPNGGGSAICGKCGHAWNTSDENGNNVDTHKLDPVEEIGGMAVQHRSYRTANDGHQLPKARWSDEVYEGMSQVAKTIKKGMKPKKTKKPKNK